MLKEPRNKIITREDIYARYFSLLENIEERSITEDFAKKINEVKIQFKDKKEIEIMIRGTILFNQEDKKLFTFLNKTYNITKEGLEECLIDLDKFFAFTKDKDVIYFSEIENEFVNQSRVLNAHIFTELR